MFRSLRSALTAATRRAPVVAATASRRVTLAAADTARRFVSAHSAGAAGAGAGAQAAASAAAPRRALAFAAGAVACGAFGVALYGAAPARADSHTVSPSNAFSKFVALLPHPKRQQSVSHSPVAEALKKALPRDADVSRLVAVFESHAVGGVLSERAYLQACAQLGMTDKQVVHSFFAALDADKSGSISLVEFVSGLALLSPAVNPLQQQEKVRLLFSLVDLDKNGRITQHELRTVIGALFQSAERVSGADPHALAQSMWEQSPLLYGLPLRHCNTVMSNILSANVMLHADTDHDGAITLTEFEQWMHTNGADVQYLLSLFGQFKHGTALTPPPTWTSAANAATGAHH